MTRYKFKMLLVDFEADNFVLPQHSKIGQPWIVYSAHQYASALLSLSHGQAPYFLQPTLYLMEIIMISCNKTHRLSTAPVHDRTY